MSEQTHQVILAKPTKVDTQLYCQITWQFEELLNKIREYMEESRETDQRVGGNFVPITPPSTKADLLAAIERLMTAKIEPLEAVENWISFWWGERENRTLTLEIKGLEGFDGSIKLIDAMITEHLLGSLKGDDSASVQLVFKEIVLNGVGFNIEGENYVIENPTRAMQRRSLFDAYQGDPKSWFV